MLSSSGRQYIVDVLRSTLREVDKAKRALLLTDPYFREAMHLERDSNLVYHNLHRAEQEGWCLSSKTHCVWLGQDRRGRLLGLHCLILLMLYIFPGIVYNRWHSF